MSQSMRCLWRLKASNVRVKKFERERWSRRNDAVIREGVQKNAENDARIYRCARLHNRALMVK